MRSREGAGRRQGGPIPSSHAAFQGAEGGTRDRQSVHESFTAIDCDFEPDMLVAATVKRYSPAGTGVAEEPKT